MCELLGMSANVPTDICFSFTGLVLRGGGTGPHKDGWGITFYEGKGCRTFKDPQPGYDYFEQTHKPPTVSIVDGRYVVSKPLSHEVVQPQLASNYTLSEAK